MPHVFVPCLNTAYVAVIGTDQTADKQQFGFHVLRDEAWTATALTTLADSVIGWLGTGDGAGNTPKGRLTLDGSFLQINARDLTTETSASIVDTDGLPLAGEDTAAHLQAGLCWALTLRTGLAGRNFRGRIYPFGFTQDLCTSEGSNSVDPTVGGKVVATYNALVGAVAASDGTHNQLVVASKYHQVVFGTPPTVPRDAGVMTPVTSIGASTYLIDFQRRRAPGHSRHH
jgi:hypothetical protein